MAGAPSEPATDPRSAPPVSRRAPFKALQLSLLAPLTAMLVACCPVTAPPPTAFTATLRALGGGEAVARLADGRRLMLTGLTTVPAGRVYVTGRLLADGRVAVAGIRQLASAPGDGP